MDFRILDKNEYEASKALWEECFHDGARFIGYYYAKRSKPEYVLGAFEGDELVSMLHMIPMNMRFDGREQPVCFVAGVCTKPSFRRRGICAALFEKAFPIMRERGFAASVLQPFDTAFYERFGYSTFITRRRVKLSYDRPRQSDDCTMIRYGRTDAARKLVELYAEFISGCGGASIRDESFFEGFMEEYSAPDARLVLTDDGCCAGYDEGGAFVCSELFFRKGTDPVSLLPGGFTEYVFPLPNGEKMPAGCEAEYEAFSMIKPLNPRFSLGGEPKYGFDRY